MSEWSYLSIALFYILLTIMSLFILLLISLYVSERFSKWWFSLVYTYLCTSAVKHGSDGIRATLFQELSFIQQKDSSKQLVILEIGPARGNNFQFYPPNCRVIALDYNSYFEKYFLENKSKFPHIICDKFVNGMAEDMKEIEDHSVDVVVGTYLLCSVKDRHKTLEEIKRVLKKGGTYFFMEHVGYPQTSFKHKLLFAIQLIFHPFWYILFDCCRCYRQSWSHIEKAGFESLNLHYDYPNKVVFIIRAHIWGTATTHKSIENCRKTYKYSV